MDALPAIMIDFPSKDEIKVKQGLVKAQLLSMVRIDGPRKSLGHTSSYPRSTLTVAFDPNLVSLVELKM